MDLTSARFQRPIRWYWLAIVCGLTPIILGSVIFAAWLIDDLDSLEMIGLGVIYVGVLLFTVGTIALVIFTTYASRAGIAHRRSTAIALIILVANFPLCVAFVSLAFAIESAHLVTIENGADVEIKALALGGPSGRSFEVGFVAPGQVRNTCPDFTGEGAVIYSFTIDGETREAVLIGYLAAPLGSRATLRVAEDLSVRTEEEFQRISFPDYLSHCLFG